MPLLLLFDVDGTLIRTGGAGVRAMNRGFRDVMGWADALGSLSPAGMTDLGIAHQVAQRYCGRLPTSAELGTIFARYLECLREELSAAEDFRVLPGVLNFLEERHRDPRLLLGLGTGNLEAGATLKLEYAGLNRYFRCGGFGSDALERAEVLRAGVRRAEALLDQACPPERVVVIGDTPLDVRAGRALGARTLAVATGPFAPEDLSAAGADGVVETFADEAAVSRFLERLM